MLSTMSTPPVQLPIAIVGANFGRHIIGELMAEPTARWFRIVAICDRDRARADAAAATCGARACYDLDEVLADPAIPVIGLFTGPVGRARLLRRIIRAGKHCMTTKPFEEDAQAALNVLTEAQRLGRAIHLNSPAPVRSPDLTVIERWRREFDLGQPISAFAETYVSYRETADGTWLDDPRHCPVAPLYRLGVYLINDLVALFGPATDVQVQSSRLFTGRPTPDNAQVGLRFANGALATVAASFAIADGDHYRSSLTLHFARGTIYRDCGPQRDIARGRLTLITGDGTTARHVAAQEDVASTSGGYRWDLLHQAASGVAILDLIPPHEIVHGLHVLDAIHRADAGTGRAEVRLPAAGQAVGAFAAE